MGWFDSLPAAVQALIRVVLFVLPVFLILPVLIWYERRLLAWFQDRIGPNRTGTISFALRNQKVPAFLRGKKFGLFGLPQILADGIKSFLKEDFAPTMVDRVLYFAAPAVFLFPAFMLGATVPWGPFPKLTPIANVDIGVLYIMAVSSLSVYGVVLAGYSSNNKYSLLGGLRSSAQLISYELGMGLSLATLAMSAGSLKPVDIVAHQQQPLWGFLPFLANHTWLTPHGLVAFVVFAVCLLAETNRAPFDLPEAESELVAGYNTEYSTKKWVLFMMGEYMSLITYSIILATLFFGGYNFFPIQFSSISDPNLRNLLENLNGNGILGPLWLLVKVAFFLSSFIWIRATLPRLRYDQLMNLGWKSLLPVAVGNLIITAFSIVVSRLYGPQAALGVEVVSILLLLALGKGLKRAMYGEDRSFESRSVVLVDSGRARTNTPEPEVAAS